MPVLGVVGVVLAIEVSPFRLVGLPLKPLVQQVKLLALQQWRFSLD